MATPLSQETNNNLVIKGFKLISHLVENYFRGAPNGAVTLYYDNVASLIHASGIQIEAGVEESLPQQMRQQELQH